MFTDRELEIIELALELAESEWRDAGKRMAASGEDMSAAMRGYEMSERAKEILDQHFGGGPTYTAEEVKT